MTVPTNPATITMPTCSSSHSEAFSGLPAASSRALIRISTLLLRRSSSAAADLAVASWSCCWGAAWWPVPVRPDVYISTASSAVISRGCGIAMREDSEEADAEGDETGVEGPGWQVGQCQDDDKWAHRAPREKSIGSTVTLECVIFSRNLGRRPVGIRPPMARPCWSKPAEWS